MQVKAQYNEDAEDKLAQMKLFEYDPIDKTFKQVNKKLIFDSKTKTVSYQASPPTLPSIKNGFKRLEASLIK